MIFFCGLTSDFFLALAQFLVKRKVNFAIEQQKNKVREKRDGLFISKMDFNFQISLWNKNFTY